MAKTTGPVFSLVASGALKKKIVFQKTPSGSKVYLDRSKKGLVAADQSQRRELFIGCKNSWLSLTEEEKETWRDNAKASPMTGYNLFIKDCLETGVVPPPPEVYFLLLETGDKILQETGDGILLE